CARYSDGSPYLYYLDFW
nr:immunoglobulin heavy chain junction region [Macaca mulatta]MOW99743.1 immunoglobulin heavy chain junction region [Macaca mulatta]MOX02944.1 immunoglobulin heavy chain junction region [Macaca mulatta]